MHPIDLQAANSSVGSADSCAGALWRRRESAPVRQGYKPERTSGLKKPSPSDTV